MSLPRSYQFIALRNLNGVARQTRQLHMTGPATFPSPALMRIERPISNLPRDVAGLRAECKKRKLEYSGSKHDLVSRLNANEITHSRAFMTAVENSKRPSVDVDAAKKPAVKRHFNTSRALKQVNDSSTIDFAYLPSFESMQRVEASQGFVPIIDGVRGQFVDMPEPEVMKPEISTMTLGSVHSPMAEVHDNTAMPIDFHAIAESVSVAVSKAKVPVVEQSGMLKQFWQGVVEDIRGPKRSLA